MKVWAHTIVKNEERYIWYAIMSVIDYVDKVLVYDTGSTDLTIPIIKEIEKAFPKKIKFKEVGNTDINKFTEIRQEMLFETKADWVWILDADEVWWGDAACRHREMMKKEIESIVVRYRNLVGDIFHYQPESAGKYNIDGKEGHLTIRGINMHIPGLTVSRPHGLQGFYDGSDKLIQERNVKKRVHLDGISYLHFTHLIRSNNLEEDRKVPKRGIKYKKELGINFPMDYFYPEVFFMDRPSIVPSPWLKRDTSYEIESALYDLPRRIKRKFFRGGSGY